MKRNYILYILAAILITALVSLRNHKEEKPVKVVNPEKTIKMLDYYRIFYPDLVREGC